MITKEYIKMCEEAEEIQNVWSPMFGDTCIVRFDGKRVVILEKGVGVEEYRVLFVDNNLKAQRNYWYSKENLKWLPTVEQLWDRLCHFYQLNDNVPEGLNWGDSIFRFAIKRFSDFVQKSETIDFNENALTFLYKQKYSKIWKNGEWI